MGFTLREAVPEDCADIARLVRALAEYEKLAHEARATEDDFRRALFGAPARAQAAVARVAGATVGFALWFYNFSTFMGREGLYVEDVFVEPAHRGAGIGRAFFRMMAARAVAERCGRMEWSVLDWNTPAIDFYRGLGVEPMSEWTVQRLSGDTLLRLASGHLDRHPIEAPSS
jgi:GNAT superfamily N-acetyltransferase